jgi:glutamate-ammonia-ligase adenylyltransferase
MPSASSPDSGPRPPDPRALLLAPSLAPEDARAILSRYGFEDPDRADALLERIAPSPGERRALADVLPDLLDLLAAAGSPDRGLRSFARLVDAAASPAAFLRSLAPDRPALERAAVLCSQSQYFADVLVREPRLLDWLGTQAEPPARDALLGAIRGDLAPLSEEAHRLAALHRFKRRELLACAHRDHVLGAPLETTVAGISRLAEALIEAALALAGARLRARVSGLPPGPLPFAVVALGKLGGGELNYSSDIDLLFVHDELFAAGELSPRELFDRLARDLVQVLSAFGDEGALYRVDLRLRPEGGQGALSRGVAAYLRYYESYGRTWERQALLKARPVAGDLDLGARWVRAVEPFVYRRYLEVAAIGEIRALKRKLEARGAAQPTRDVKEGPGGIRDIEFTVQFLLLLYGGELAEVRDPSTLGAIAKLEAAGALAAEDARGMREAYVFLRRVEHRLQSLFSLQTHALPPGAPEEADLAHRLDYRGDDARARFLADLDRHGQAARAVLERVLHGLFPEVAGPSAEVSELILDPDPPPEKVARALTPHGIKDPARALQDLRRMAQEKSRFLGGSPRTRTTFASLLPRLLRALAEHPDPDETLNRLERATGTLGGKAVFYQLLAEQADFLDLFVRVAADSAFLTGLLTRSPGVFDELVDRLLTAEPVTVGRLVARITAAGQGSREEALRSAFVSTQLLVGFHDLGERWNVANVLEALSALAEATLRALLPEGSGLTLFALGKLGGRELGYGSDLDLLSVYDGDDAEGAIRATRTLLRDLEGLSLYSVDFRLRPEGTQGPLASSLEAIERYLSQRAATWERLAVTKIRPVAGQDEPARRRHERILAALYGRPAAPGFEEEVRAMRRRLEEAAPGELDLKRSPGGLLDIEFAVAALRLRARGEPRDVRDPGSVPALHALARAGLLSRAAYVDLLTGYQLLRKIEARLRIVEGRAVSMVPGDPAQRRALARRLGYVDTARRRAEVAFLDELRFHMKSVRARFVEIVGAPP